MTQTITTLKPSQLKFAQGYVITGNATESYKQAYNPQMEDRRAESSASRLLSNAKVQEYIKELKAELETQAVATAREVAEMLLSIAKTDMTIGKGGVAVAALKEIKKMYGYDAPEKKEVQHSNLSDIIKQLTNGSES